MLISTKFKVHFIDSLVFFSTEMLQTLGQNAGGFDNNSSFLSENEKYVGIHLTNMQKSTLLLYHIFIMNKL